MLPQPTLSAKTNTMFGLAPVAAWAKAPNPPFGVFSKFARIDTANRCSQVAGHREGDVCLRLAPHCPHGGGTLRLCPLNVETSRPLCANTGCSPTALRRVQI